MRPRWRPRAARRIHGRDRVFLGDRAVWLIGPLELPTTAALRAALVRLAASDPRHWLLRKLDHRTRRWRPVSPADLADHLTAMVQPLGAADERSPEDVARALLCREPDEVPLRFHIGAQCAAVAWEHVLGDAATVLPVFADVLETALTGSAYPGPPRRATPMPTIRAIGRSLRDDPGRLRRAISVDTGSPASTATRGEATRREVIAVRSHPSYRDRLSELRSAHAPEASASAVLFAAALSALERSGIPFDPEVSVLVDLRRYLAPSAVVDGNFLSAATVHVVSPVSATELHRQLQRTLESGRPAIALALASLLEHLPRRAPRPSVPRRLAVSLTHVGDMRALGALPWRAPSDERDIVMVGDCRANRLSIAMGTLDGCLFVDAAFDATRLDPDVLRGALKLVCDAPEVLVPGVGVPVSVR